MLSIALVAGLGNPGQEYAASRHNLGAYFVQQVARLSDAAGWESKKRFRGAICQIQSTDGTLHLLVPNTFVNCSGDSIAATLAFFKFSSTQLLVAHDDLDLPEGTVRLKYGGGHGGHNGLRHIMHILGTDNFYRLRFGIGKPDRRNQVTGYVLRPNIVHDNPLYQKAIDHAFALFPLLIRQPAVAMSQLNRKKSAD